MSISTQERDVMWQAVDEIGLEHLHLTTNYQGTVAGGLVVGLSNGIPYRAHYVIRTDSSWRTREVRLMLIGSSEPPVVLLSDGAGTWTNGDGLAVPKLDGAIDVDITATPFTNTLPIRRLQLLPGQGQEITVAYLELPLLRLYSSRQRYTLLEDGGPDGERYHFEALDSDFEATITVDGDGLVVDYPGLFRRVWAR